MNRQKDDTFMRVQKTTMERLKNIKNGRSCDKTLNDLIALHNELIEDMQGYNNKDKDDLSVKLF